MLPVCELLGPGKQRETITVLGYLFYIGDRTKTDSPLSGKYAGQPWVVPVAPSVKR